MNDKAYYPLPDSIIDAKDVVCCEGTHFVSFMRADDSETQGAHIHSFCEIYVNVSGDVSFMVENRVYPISSGDVIITRANEVHHCIYHSDCEHEHYCVWLALSENILSDLGACFLNRRLGEGNLISMKPNDKEKLFEYLERLCVEEGETKEYKRDAEGLSALFGILALLEKYRKYTLPAKKLPESMEGILAYIDMHFFENFSVDDIANEFFMSRSALCGMFKKHLNLSPSKYIEAKRLALAKKLLEKGESVQSVCDACGFSDCSYFISVFKKHFGITPYRYSREIKM